MAQESPEPKASLSVQKLLDEAMVQVSTNRASEALAVAGLYKYAGARSIVASQWKVADLNTAKLMDRRPRQFRFGNWSIARRMV